MVANKSTDEAELGGEQNTGTDIDPSDLDVGDTVEIAYTDGRTVTYTLWDVEHNAGRDVYNLEDETGEVVFATLIVPFEGEAYVSFEAEMESLRVVEHDPVTVPVVVQRIRGTKRVGLNGPSYLELQNRVEDEGDVWNIIREQVDAGAEDEGRVGEVVVEPSGKFEFYLDEPVVMTDGGVEVAPVEALDERAQDAFAPYESEILGAKYTSILAEDDERYYLAVHPGEIDTLVSEGIIDSDEASVLRKHYYDIVGDEWRADDPEERWSNAVPLGDVDALVLNKDGSDQ